MIFRIMEPDATGRLTGWTELVRVIQNPSTVAVFWTLPVVVNVISVVDKALHAFFDIG